jgi:hypothetical protein
MQIQARVKVRLSVQDVIILSLIIFTPFIALLTIKEKFMVSGRRANLDIAFYN